MKLVNIYNNKRKIYLFCRNDKGELEIKIDNSFFPYFYERDEIDGKFKSYIGEKLRKIFVTNPSDVPKRRSNNSYEADIIYTKRYMIDKIDKLEKCLIKYAFIDIEVLANEMPNPNEAKHKVSCISVYNSMYKSIQTFYLGNYQTEYALFEDFVRYMKKEKFDLWLSWNVKFDYNYLATRFPDFAEKISPIGMVRYGDENVLYPAGISIVDYLTFFKKVTLNREQSYALDNIAQVHLNEKTYEKIDFGILNPKIKEKNINDIKRMVKLEEKFKLIDYFDEIRRLSKVEWEDMVWNSRVLDMLLLQEAKNNNVILPMKPEENRGTLSEKEEFEGAYREALKVGRFTNGVGKYDLASCYPSMIIDFCLDPANIIEKEENKIKVGITIEGTKFYQNPNTLLPTVVKKLTTLKNEIKQKLSTLKLNSQEYKDTKQKYNAIKTIVNSAYGVFGNRFFRLYNKNVASATAYLVRDLLHYVQNKLEGQGHEIIYIDTDGIMINNNKEDLSNLLNKYVKEWAKVKYGKENLTTEFSYEGYYEKLLILTKCRYKGWLKTDKGIEIETKGIEAKRKDSTKYMKQFQTELIDKIVNKESKENIINWIKKEIKELPNKPLIDIAFPCKLARKPEEYKNVPIFLRALKNSSLKKRVGEPFYYIFVKPEEQTKINTIIKVKSTEDKSYESITINKNLTRKEGIEYAREIFKEPDLDSKRISILHKKEKPKDVVAFDENTVKNIKNIDWEMMIKRNIIMKLDTIFEALKWDLKEINLESSNKVAKETKCEYKQKINSLSKKEPIICDFEQCKSNKEGECQTEDPELCPKNNEISVYEKENLIKDEIKKITPYYEE